ncbi:helix-turn-helix transcriptional regulator [Roseiconus lacunae]|uniref:helix-turn-helix domain-containing protein n=1 Tax=Roseiconus lacunae TaxID=2605694 RepID=UPI003086DC7E|nr:helix-turn-helix transcriptional regulator [Stieleria sp. HD01]
MEKSIESDGHRKLAELLRTLRVESGQTQIDLADRLGETQSAVSKAESGQRRLDLVQLATYANALGIKVSKLVERWERVATKR